VASLQDLEPSFPLNQANPLNRGRVAWWLATPQRFGGPSFYDLVQGMAGTLTNLPAGYGWSTFTNPGGVGSVRFNGGATGGYVSVPDVPSLRPTTLTIGASVYFTAFTSSNSAVICKPLVATDGAAWTTPFISYMLRVNASGTTAEFSCSPGNVYVTSTVTYTFSLNTWYRLYGIYTGSSLLLYVCKNGNIVASGSNARTGAITYASVPLYLGTDSSGNVNKYDRSACYINDAFVANRAWSVPEIQADLWQSQNGYPDVLTFRNEETAVDVWQPIQPSPAGAFVAWQDVELDQPVHRSHPLNAGLQMRLLALPQRFGGPKWYDLVKGTPFSLSGFGAGFGWSTASNPGGAGSVAFQHSVTNQVTGPSKSLVSGSSTYTWFGWVRHTNVDLSNPASNQFAFGERPVSANWNSRLGLNGPFTASSSSFPFGAVPGGVSFALRDDAGHSTVICGSDSISDGNWHFIAAVRNGNQGAVYWSIGSQLKTSGFAALNGSPGNTTTSSPVVAVGYDPANSAATWDGNINDVGCILQALTPQQIQALFWESQNGYPNLLQWRDDNLDLIITISRKLQVKRGPSVHLPILSAGELGFTTDNNLLYVGDGSANHLVGGDMVSPPPHSNSIGTPNQWAWDGTFLYRCVAVNTWVRLAVTSSF
jgi:hypothetical protein